MDDLPSSARRRAIEDIVQAVGEDEHWRVGCLMERFVMNADRAALVALREALSQVAGLRDRWHRP
ncbi:hypothetical protein ACWCPS_39405 [Streptomyces mauvecolor]